jgi:hypothetical protein
MPIFRRRKALALPEEHAVITHLPLSDDQFGTKDERDVVHELEARITAAVKAIGGEHDGDEFGNGEAVLYTYGPDADQLFGAIRQCLVGVSLRPGAYAIKRYGPADNPNAPQERVPL